MPRVQPPPWINKKAVSPQTLLVGWWGVLGTWLLFEHLVERPRFEAAAQSGGDSVACALLQAGPCPGFGNQWGGGGVCVVKATEAAASL
jgi:hypothetical protein